MITIFHAADASRCYYLCKWGTSQPAVLRRCRPRRRHSEARVPSRKRSLVHLHPLQLEGGAILQLNRHSWWLADLPLQQVIVHRNATEIEITTPYEREAFPLEESPRQLAGFDEQSINMEGGGSFQKRV
jgi:hypothetical protein